MTRTPHRVVQWTTGNVGKSSVQAIAANPTLELVGCYAWSADKVGRDVGELCGIDAARRHRHRRRRRAARAAARTASSTTRCGCDVDELVRILVGRRERRVDGGVHHRRNGSAPTATGSSRRASGAARRCSAPGISPGFAELLAIVADDRSATGSTRSRSTRRPTPPSTTRPPPSDRPASACRSTTPTCPGWRPRAPPCSARRCAWSPTRSASSSTRCAARPSTPRPPTDLDLGSWTIAAGCVAGVAASWQGLVGDQVVVELNVRWRKGPTLEPDWKIEQDGWVIQIDGRPTVTLNVGFLPPPDFEAETIADFMVLGHIMTAMPAAQRHPGRGGRPARHRHLQRPAAHRSPRLVHRAVSGPWRSSARRSQQVVARAGWWYQPPAACGAAVDVDRLAGDVARPGPTRGTPPRRPSRRRAPSAPSAPCAERCPRTPAAPAPWMPSVSVMSGASAFTRMPWGASSSAAVFV